MKNKKIEFTAGISYEEHLVKAQKTYDTIVRPQVKAELKRKKNNPNEKLVLSPIQKAYSECQNPI